MQDFGDAMTSTSARASAGKAENLGLLPEWNLADLYEGPDSDGFRRDVEQARQEVAAFAATWQGKLAASATGGGAKLGEAVRSYEALSDLIGRIGSYAMLYYVGDTVDPARQKFHGDMQAALTEISTVLLFFELELNRIDDAAMEAALGDPGLGRYRPWIRDLRRQRPHQLDD